MDLGNKALMARDYKGAIAAFREAYERFPSPRILMNLGSALRDAGQFAEAVVVYEKYLGDPSRDPSRDGEVRTALESARAQLGGKTYSADDIARSKELMVRGLEAVQAGRYDDALQAFRDAHQHNPLPEFLHNQAHCLEKLNAPLSAARLYREFAEATPEQGRGLAGARERCTTERARRQRTHHRDRPGRWHGMDAARQPAADGAQVQRGRGRIPGRLSHLPGQQVHPQRGGSAGRRRALRRGRPGVPALPVGSQRAAGRRGA